MLDFAANTSDTLSVVSCLVPSSSSLDVSCLDGRVTAHPMFSLAIGVAMLSTLMWRVLTLTTLCMVLQSRVCV